MLLPLKSIQRLRIGIVATILALGLAGCATEKYVAPIERFSAATDAATMALTAIDASATERLTAMALHEASKDARQIKPNTGRDCTTTGERCILIVTLSDPASTKLPLNSTSLLSNSARVMSSLQLYGHALAEVATADASEEVRGGLEKSVSAVTSMASVFGLPLGPALAPLKDLALAGFQQYQNSIKLGALQRATQAADPIVKESMERLAAEASFARTGTLAELAEEYRKARLGVDDDATEPNIAKLIDAAFKFDAALTANSANVFTKVAEAHAALTKDLRNPQASFAEVLAAIDVVLTEAGLIQDFANAVTADNR